MSEIILKRNPAIVCTSVAHFTMQNHPEANFTQAAVTVESMKASHDVFVRVSFYQDGQVHSAEVKLPIKNTSPDGFVAFAALQWTDANALRDVGVSSFFQPKGGGERIENQTFGDNAKLEEVFSPNG